MAENDAMFSLPRFAHANALSCLCLAIFVPVSFAQESKQFIMDEVQDLLHRQMGWDDNLPGKMNPAGLSFQFFKTDETTSTGKRLASYRAYVPGAPENKKYTLSMWRIGSDPHILSNEIYVNAKGLLMVHKPRPEEEESDFAGGNELQLFVSAARGDAVRYSLASADRQLLIFGTLVPFPLRDADDRGCLLEVRLVQPDARVVLISADGLPPSTEVPFQMVTSDVPDTEKFNTNAQGHAVTAGVVFVEGKDRGSLRVTLDTKDCSTAVEIPWGKGSYKPL
jgi:hypothetical protein